MKQWPRTNEKKTSVRRGTKSRATYNPVWKHGNVNAKESVGVTHYVSGADADVSNREEERRKKKRGDAACQS